MSIARIKSYMDQLNDPQQGLYARNDKEKWDQLLVFVQSLHASERAQSQPEAVPELTDSQIMASVGRNAGKPDALISETRPLGQQWEQVCGLVRHIIRERYCGIEPLTSMTELENQEPVAWAVYWGLPPMRKNSVHFGKESAQAVAAEIKSCGTEIRPLYAAPVAHQDTEMLDWLGQHDGRYYNIDRISSIVGTGFLTVSLDGNQQKHTTLRAAIAASKGQS